MDIVLDTRTGASMSRHAARIARDHCLAPERVDAPISGGRYRSLFEDLSPLSVDEGALHALGRPGGPCDLAPARYLIALPTQVSGSAPGTDYASLANRDLQRGQAVGLASGEAIADRLGVPALSPEQVGLAEHGWSGETPLWFYILKEADVLHDGDRMGPVGGRIVGEVLVGIIDADPQSFRSVDPDWTPTLPARRSGAFGLADIKVPDAF
jgi:hypothetical protein